MHPLIPNQLQLAVDVHTPSMNIKTQEMANPVDFSEYLTTGANTASTAAIVINAGIILALNENRSPHTITKGYTTRAGKNKSMKNTKLGCELANSKENQSFAVTIAIIAPKRPAPVMN